MSTVGVEILPMSVFIWLVAAATHGAMVRHVPFLVASTSSVLVVKVPSTVVVNVAATSSGTPTSVAIFLISASVRPALPSAGWSLYIAVTNLANCAGALSATIAAALAARVE